MGEIVKNKNICAVAICPSPPEASYHRFPKDEKLQKIWIQLCKRKDNVNAKTAKVCSSHFKSEDYERDLRNELLNLPTRKILKPGALPSLNLLPESSSALDKR